MSSDELLGGVVRAISAINTMPLDVKIQWLKSNRSTDAVQQMQSDAIVELYDVVKQIQRSLSSIPPLPGASAVREAAEKAAAEKRLLGAAMLTPASSAFKRWP